VLKFKSHYYETVPRFSHLKVKRDYSKQDSKRSDHLPQDLILKLKNLLASSSFPEVYKKVQ
jgi:hypothetical protein